MSEESQEVTTVTGYLVLGSTGCSCCHCDNFVEGIYFDLAAAKSSVEDHIKRRTVSSQYSHTGVYEIRQGQFEPISNGRFILDKRVCDESLYESGEHLYNEFYWSTTPAK